tara:strand:- start:299 stop:466 length:168 start_codon:yes stop_codon:yes gene_type:complete
MSSRQSQEHPEAARAAKTSQSSQDQPGPATTSPEQRFSLIFIGVSRFSLKNVDFL